MLKYVRKYVESKTWRRSQILEGIDSINDRLMGINGIMEI